MQQLDEFSLAANTHLQFGIIMFSFKETFITKYISFHGRASRKEYWLANLIFLLAILFSSLVAVTVDTNVPIFLLFLASFLPLLALSVRRLHDTGRSGWWYLINLIPYVGFLCFLVIATFESQSGTNKYGPNPYGVENDNVV